MQFDTVIGSGRKKVTVEFEIDNYGQFQTFYVVGYFDIGPEDIKEYLSSYEIELLQYQAAMLYREAAVDRNEIGILRHFGLKYV